MRRDEIEWNGQGNGCPLRKVSRSRRSLQLSWGLLLAGSFLWLIPAAGDRATLAQTPAHSPRSAPLGDRETELRTRAERLHRSSIVIDTHNDVTSFITDEGFDLGTPDPSGKIQTDLGKMRRGGIGAEFFSIYVASKYAREGGSARRAMEMIDGVYEQLRRHPNDLVLATTAADIRRIHQSGKIAALMGIEGGHAIEDSLAALRMFHRLGVRYMTLTHTNTNNWADSAGGISVPAEAKHGGLNAFGREVVQEMNRLGMMVDISHVADQTFWAVLETTRAPVIASHSSARALTNVGRNLSDEMLRAVARNGGVVMVNFYNAFINTEYAPAGQPRPTRGIKTATLEMLLRHFEHIIQVAGIDHVGIGSDYDGVDGEVPPGMEDISKLPTLTYELLRRGYREEEIRKVLGENLLRVMARTEEVAQSLQAAGQLPSQARLQP